MQIMFGPEGGIESGLEGDPNAHEGFGDVAAMAAFMDQMENTVEAGIEGVSVEAAAEDDAVEEAPADNRATFTIDEGPGQSAMPGQAGARANSGLGGNRKDDANRTGGGDHDQGFTFG